MITKLSIFRIVAGLPAESALLDAYLMRGGFAPTTPNQALATGWVPPRAEHGAFVEAIAGHWIATIAIETRTVPSDALQRRIDELVQIVERTTGRKPGRKERREIKEAANAELLPQAFPKRVNVPVWIDPARGLLMIGTTTDTKAEHAIMGLVRCVPDFAVHPLETQHSPAGILAGWIQADGDAAEPFSLGRECELLACDESAAKVRYSNTNLSTSDVRDRIAGGMIPKRVALTFGDRVAFTVTDKLRLLKIEMLGAALNGDKGMTLNDEAFDADAVIFCGEMRPAIEALVDAFGGYAEAKPAPEPAPARGRPEAPPVSPDEPAAPFDDDGADPLIDRARGLVIARQKASISLLQSTLLIGYNRAARLLEALEAEGVVSHMRSDGSFDVIEGIPA